MKTPLKSIAFLSPKNTYYFDGFNSICPLSEIESLQNTKYAIAFLNEEHNFRQVVKNVQIGRIEYIINGCYKLNNDSSVIVFPQSFYNLREKQIRDSVLSKNREEIV